MELSKGDICEVGTEKYYQTRLELVCNKNMESGFKATHDGFSSKQCKNTVKIESKNGIYIIKLSLSHN